MLFRSRFAPSLLISIRDDSSIRRPTSAPAATAVEVPGAPTDPAKRSPDTMRDPGTAPDAAVPLRPATPFEVAATVIDGAVSSPSAPPIVPTPLPARVETAPGTSVLVAEPVPAARKGDSERLPVKAVPVTETGRRGPDTTTGWLAASWRTWSPGTRFALGFAGLAVLLTAALLIFLAVRGGAPRGGDAVPAVALAPQPDAAVVASDASSHPPPADAFTAAPADAAAVKLVPDAAASVMADALDGTTSAPTDAAGDVVAEDAGPPNPRDAASATGRVTIDSRPWSVVTWRDRVLGETPVVDAELPAGMQSFVLTDEAGVQHRRSLRVLPGKSVRIRFELAEPDS